MSDSAEQVSYSGSLVTRKVRRKKFRRTIKTFETNDRQLPMEALPLGTSFEVMSKVSRNPFVPLNS